tara:strand:+ start:68 stop:313 length:246 start_codon:yes stop_codon:yes gene_type:complete
MHHPSKHLVLKEGALEKIVSKTLLKNFNDVDEMTSFITFALLTLSNQGVIKPRLDVWLDDVINEYLITQYEEENGNDVNER